MSSSAPKRWSPEILEHLRALLATNTTPRPAAAFDFDHTCVHGDIGLTTAHYHDLTFGTSLFEAYRSTSAKGQSSLACADLAAGILKGRTRPEVHQLAEQAFASELGQSLLSIEPEIEALIGSLIQAGWEVWIVTASPAAVVEPLAARLGVPSSQVIGYEGSTDAEGRFTGELLKPWPHGAGKAEAVGQKIHRPLGFAAGDSAQDAPLLSLARKALVVDRGDQDLAQEANANGWWIQKGWGGYLKPSPG